MTEVFCRDCLRLELKGNPKPFCTWHGAFLSPDLLGQAWQCEGYKKRG